LTRLVLDTNVVIAGLLWSGPPYRLLDFAIDDLVTLYSSPVLSDELAHTLNYPKFSKRIAQAATTPAELALRYSAVVTLVSPLQVPRVVPNDADDDHVIACAIAARAEWIVSGDQHLLALGRHADIPIVTARTALIELSR
jgi:putative PIN family toxin of toxin-antitoxin system